MQDDIDHLLGVDKENHQRSVAQFILKLKESKQVSQVVIDEVVDGCQSMFQHTVRRLRADVTAKLAAAGVDVSNILGLDDLFEQVPQPFEDLETRHKQEKYFRENLGLIVSNNIIIIHVVSCAPCTSDPIRSIQVLKQVSDMPQG